MPTVTLGISTNTRLISYAVVFQGQLIDYATHLHKAPWSPAKASEIVASLEPCVRRHRIKKVVLSIPHAHHQTEAFQSLVLHIHEFFAKQNIPVHAETAQAVYTLCPPEQKKTKKNLMHVLCLQYPQLTYCYRKELRNKTKYYIKLFEAVAAASLNA